MTARVQTADAELKGIAGFYREAAAPATFRAAVLLDQSWIPGAG
jgi:hypothetical protein